MLNIGESTDRRDRDIDVSIESHWDNGYTVGVGNQRNGVEAVHARTAASRMFIIAISLQGLAKKTRTVVPSGSFPTAAQSQLPSSL